VSTASRRPRPRADAGGRDAHRLSYADVRILRHPADGAARLAASVSPFRHQRGRGSHEHPTQTLPTFTRVGDRVAAAPASGKDHFRGKHVAGVIFAALCIH
jgi:hypothetical protein